MIKMRLSVFGIKRAGLKAEVGNCGFFLGGGGDDGCLDGWGCIQMFGFRQEEDLAYFLVLIL